jgi:glyoxylase-like metal-dependent hydrolase (beta-lactamase superfamily II)
MAENPSGKFLTMAGAPPEEAKFFWTGGPVEVAERTWFASALSGVTAFETDDGLVLVDTGAVSFAPDLATRIRQASDKPVHTAIYTHGHVDHAFGLSHFLLEGQKAPTVIGHSAMLDRFGRYGRTSGLNRAVNARQFQGVADAGLGGVVFEAPSILPDTLYDDELTVEVGGVTFELHHARGETDDHTWVYSPSRGVLCPGDLIIWGVPNAGNPQKVQRYPWEWADALRAMAALSPRSMCPGHGGPVIDDADLVLRILVETADYLDAIVERTLTALDAGGPPHVDIVREVELPATDSPWLQPVYDEGEFIVRNVVRFFGGWYSGRPSELKPPTRAALASEVVALAGGAAALLDRAEASADLRVACSLADYALEADPADEAVRARVAAIYERRADAETSLMAINIFRSAAAYASEGRAYR